MANRRQYYFDELVTEDELNEGFDGMELADRAISADQGVLGVMSNGVVTQHSPTPSLVVDVTGQSAGYDQQGRRVYIPSNQSVSLAVDSTAVSTAVVTVGNEKIVSLFVRFKRANSDGRTDGNAVALFFVQDESFEFIVRQGAEALAGTAVPPALESDGYLLADVKFTQGMSQIFNAAIDLTHRRQDAYVATAGAMTLRAGTTVAAAQQLLVILNNHVNNLASSHPASAITYAGSGTWKDGGSIPNTGSVEDALDQIVSDLASDLGTGKIGFDGFTAGAVSIGVVSLKNALRSLMQSANINFTGGATWADGSTNPAAAVQTQLAKILTDLGGSSGALKIGRAATANLASTLLGTALNQLDARKLDNTVNNAGVAASIAFAATHGIGVLQRVDKTTITDANGITVTVNADEYRIPPITAVRVFALAAPTVNGVRVRFTKPTNTGSFSVSIGGVALFSSPSPAFALDLISDGLVWKVSSVTTWDQASFSSTL